MIYSATRQDSSTPATTALLPRRQGFFVGIGIIVMYVVSLIDYRRLEILTTPFYVCSLLGLSVSISSVKRPSGHSAGTASAYCRYNERVHRADTHSRGGDVLSAKTGGAHHVHVVRLLVMAAVPLLLIVLQPDSAHRSSSS